MPILVARRRNREAEQALRVSVERESQDGPFQPPHRQTDDKTDRGMSPPYPVTKQAMTLRSTSAPKYQCPHCAVNVGGHHDFQAHMLTHSQGERHVCSKCQSHFRRPHDLERHIKLDLCEVELSVRMDRTAFDTSEPPSPLLEDETLLADDISNAPDVEGLDMDNDTTPDMSDLQAYAGPSTTSDRVKNVLEMFFCQQIIWWPLAEPIRPLKSGMTRYVVKCTDQCTDYIDLPILSERPVMPFPRHQVSQRRRTVLHTSTLSTDPRAGETAIGPGPSSSLQSPPLARSSRLTATGQTPATNSATSHQIISIAPGKKAQKPGSWIYWCVTGRDKNYKVVDINAAKTVSTPQTQQTLITAAELSRQLLFHYRKHTRWLVRLMTISWCASGILSEFIYIGVGANDDITPTAICRPSKEPPTLPDALEYDYEKFSHTPGFDVQKAYLQGAIRHYMVEHVRFQWPRRFGDPITCTPDDNGLCDMAKFVDRIPKKSPLSVPKAQGEGAYCLEARTELSFFKAVCLLFLSTLGCVIFAIVYMKQHPDDWEKGVVPLTLVLAGVPVYLGLIVLWKANVS